MHDTTNDYTDKRKAADRWEELKAMNTRLSRDIRKMQDNNRPMKTREWLMLGCFAIVAGLAVWYWVFKVIP